MYIVRRAATSSFLRVPVLLSLVFPGTEIGRNKRDEEDATQE